MYRPFKSYDKRWGHPTCFSLWASSPGCSGSGAGKGRRACNYVSGIWILPPIPLWLPIDLAVRFSPISANVNKHCKHMPRVMMSLLMSPSANEHFASTFLMQIFKFQRRSCKLSFLFPPRHQPRSQGSVLPIPAEWERERDPGWVWSCGSRTKVIMTEVSLVSQFCVSFTQWSQVSATISETIGNLCPNRTATQ